MRTLCLAAILVGLAATQEFLTAPPPGQRTEGGVWPLPQSIKYLDANRTLGSAKSHPIQIQFDHQHEDCDVLQFARRTYLQKWLMPFEATESNGANGLKLKVSVVNACPGTSDFPQQDMDEEYFLNVPESGEAVLEAHDVWGALRGLETFSQLIFWRNESYVIRTAEVRDFPRFRVRGVLLDTSRHYLHPRLLKRQIDLMAQNKMNLLHWHIVDIESFPFESAVFPQLHQHGAYSPRHTYDRDTVLDILHYARLRGVRVMVEFDTPGHTGSWGGQEGLLASCVSPTGEKIASNILDPTKNDNYQFLSDLFKEIVSVFPEQFLHLGGDEVEFFTEACWRRNPDIRRFMKLHGFPDNVTALEDFYFNKLQKLLNPLIQGHKKVFWQEVFDNNNPDPDAIIHVWKGNTRTERAAKLQEVTRAGHQVILSSCWYLNYIHYGADWKEGSGAEYYYCDPHDFEGSEEQKALVLGGIATMWAEFIDGTNLEARLWPRASAVAERLWSDAGQTKDADAAWARLHEHRCRMVARGYRAQPGNGPSFCPLEWDLP